MENKPKIILIDDEESIVKFMLVALKKMGYLSDFSTNSADAFEMIKKNNYDIVLLDLFMPKESGLNLLIKIKKMNIRTQVIIITGYGSEFSLTACLKNGADDFICKPFDLDDLKESIEHCCSKLERWGKIETAEKIGGAEINNGVYNLDLKKKKKMKRNLKL